MPVRTHAVNVVSLVLCLSLLALQNSCSNSGSGDAQAPSTNPAATLSLDLATTNGVTAIVADGQSTVPIRITVANGVGMPMSGVSVTFATTNGTLSPSPVVRVAQGLSSTGLNAVTRANGNSLTDSTDTNGIAQVLLTASTTAGLAIVTADVQGFRTHVNISFTAGPAARVQLNTSTNAVNASGTATLTATVTDANGNPVPRETVRFTFSTNTSGASFRSNNESFSSINSVTDDNGQTVVTYTAGSTAGADTIRALATSTSVAESVSITVTATSSGGTTSPVVSHIDLLVNSPQLDSDGSDTVTLTALVRTATNNIVSGAVVSFTADSGLIQVVRATTDATGTATALLTTGGNPANGTINVTATTGTLTPAMNTVQVTGTTLTLSGATSAVLNSPIPLSILLRDSAGIGIPNGRVTVTTDFTGAVPITVTTDFTGTATVDVKASEAGTHTINAVAEALRAPALPLEVNISGDDFVLRIPDPNAPTMSITTLDLGTSYTMRVEWQRNGMNIPDGRIVNFFTTRGMLSAPSAVTVNGIATMTISSAQAGSAVINAVGIDLTESPSSQINIQFRAVTPSAMLLQAMPTTLGVNAAGSTAQQSVITAIVQDATGNLVGGREVRFLLTDTTGGTIFPAAAVTDDFGRASTVYTAGSVPSAQDGVTIQATVTGTTVVQQVSLTVARQALFVTLGTGNVILTPSNIQFALPYSILVTDTNGNSVTNATVELTVLPTRYQKGIYVQNGPPCTSWVQMVSSVCPNEDVNHNGVLDRLPFDEDTNDNNELDPENSASVPASIMTDATGFAFFNVVYAREFASWIEVDLRARATVAGSEGLSHAVFFLSGLASDYMNCSVPPPGVMSPYGTSLACTDPN